MNSASCGVKRTGHGQASRPGRSWRPLVDSAVSDPELQGAPESWTSWRRSIEDYFDEAILVWLEADIIIRETTLGKRSLDDFFRGFFGGAEGPPAVKTVHPRRRRGGPGEGRAVRLARLL